ncbi:hypothetical protein UA08_02382 [Talaromyces atroroseus]|uniref:Major facilitator superfamily (MFS) profile domain-containing protein n=1 Tax=Talaromyces atroroseus TaxID=1441469 RepID=A0A225AUU6_TALAT|nr:hypothetical protein UA08_02382 [Talaromyces atroroseus]OKL62154.1 hypothetical protein UA08_02382 [Talaromyces atroroseus]
MESNQKKIDQEIEQDVAPLRDPNARPECFSNTFQECLFVLTSTMATGQSSFFQGAVIVVLAEIGKDLNMTSAEITWTTAGISLSSGAFLLSFGKVADMFGRRTMFISSMIGYTLALLVIGFANSALYFDVLSGVMGLFCASSVPPAVGLLGATYEKPSQRKNKAFACFSAGNPMGYVGGMLVSGIASQVSTWRASFWALAVIYAIFSLISIWSVPKEGNSPYKVSLTWENLKKLDPVGMLLAVSGIALFSSSLSLAGDAPKGWGTPYVIVLLILGIVLIGAFLFWQSIYSHPLMPLFVWRDHNFSLLMGALSLGFMAFISGQFWMALYMQEVQGYTGLGITVRLLPMVVSGVLVNVVCAFVLHRVSNKLLMLIGTTAYTVSFLIMSFTKANSIYWGFYFVPLVLMVVGADIEFNVVNMYVMSSLPPSQQSLAGGIFNTVSKLVSNVGLGVTTAIYNAVRNQGGSSVIRPYAATYWFATAIAGVAILTVPFLKIGTQGGNHASNERSDEESLDQVGDNVTVQTEKCKA